MAKILAIIVSVQMLKNFNNSGANKLLDQSASGYEQLDQGLFAQFIQQIAYCTGLDKQKFSV